MSTGCPPTGGPFSVPVEICLGGAQSPVGAENEREGGAGDAHRLEVSVSAPIGVFDSGVGGLTVAAAIIEMFPNESMVYFGDTARIPYGIKSKETVERFAVEDMSFLMRFDPKLVVVACNTASANAMERLEKGFDCPIINVVGPGAARACSVTGSGRIGLIATEATVKSKAYERAVLEVAPDAKVFARPCPLFVPMVEEGRAGDDPIVRAVAWEYLSAFDDLNVDTLILGCTHYPVLKDAIAECMPGVQMVDSATATAAAISQSHEALLERGDGGGEGQMKPAHTFFVSDHPERFRAIGRRMTGLPLEDVRLVDLSDIVMV
jgi:glutamate racemase